MRAVLEFNLPEEQSEFDMANNAGHYFSTLWDLLQLLRDKAKYGESQFVDINELREEIYRDIVRDEIKHTL